MSVGNFCKVLLAGSTPFCVSGWFVSKCTSWVGLGNSGWLVGWLVGCSLVLSDSFLLDSGGFGSVWV